MRLSCIFVLLRDKAAHMHANVHLNSGAGSGPADRAGLAPRPSGGSDRRRLLRRPTLQGLRATGFKPAPYSLMHLTVAISGAYPLTRDWRITRGFGALAPVAACMLDEQPWSCATAATPPPTGLQSLPIAWRRDRR